MPIVFDAEFTTEKKVARFLAGLNEELADERLLSTELRHRILVAAVPAVTAYYLKGQ